MRSSAPLLLLGALAAAPVAQEADSPHPLHVVFVGDVGLARTTAFGEFLRTRFARVEVVSRTDADRTALLGADLVILDWPQSETARAERAEHSSPLGDRAGWTVPTVLLGSAGLNLAGAWEVRGGFG